MFLNDPRLDRNASHPTAPRRRYNPHASALPGMPSPPAPFHAARRAGRTQRSDPCAFRPCHFAFLKVVPRQPAIPAGDPLRPPPRLNVPGVGRRGPPCANARQSPRSRSIRRRRFRPRRIAGQVPGELLDATPEAIAQPVEVVGDRAVAGVMGDLQKKMAGPIGPQVPRKVRGEGRCLVCYLRRSASSSAWSSSVARMPSSMDRVVGSRSEKKRIISR